MADVTFLSYAFDPVPAARLVRGGRLIGISETAPSLKAFAGEQVKTHLGIQTDREDFNVTNKITVARRILEHAYDIAIGERTVTADFTGPAKELFLPRHPFVELTSVTEIVSGSSSAQDVSNYYVEGSIPASLRRNDANAFSLTDGYVRVVYTSGWEEESDIPAEVTEAINHVVYDLMRFKGDIEIAQSEARVIRNLPVDLKILMERYKRDMI